MKNLFLIFFSSLLLFSCEEKADRVCCLPSIESQITGSWILYEYGYSPGDEYIVEDVPLDPAQTVTFENGIFISTIEELKKIKHYLILEDRQHELKVLALYENDPGKTLQDVNKLEHSYNMTFENGLKLSRRWCKEGCHLGFKRILEK